MSWMDKIYCLIPKPYNRTSSRFCFNSNKFKGDRMQLILRPSLLIILEICWVKKLNKSSNRISYKRFKIICLRVNSKNGKWSKFRKKIRNGIELKIKSKEVTLCQETLGMNNLSLKYHLTHLIRIIKIERDRVHIVQTKIRIHHQILHKMSKFYKFIEKIKD